MVDVLKKLGLCCSCFMVLVCSLTESPVDIAETRS